MFSFSKYNGIDYKAIAEKPGPCTGTGPEQNKSLLKQLQPRYMPYL